LIFQKRLIAPALILPLLTLLLSLALRYAHSQKWLSFNLDQAALFGLILASLVSAAYACMRLKVRPDKALRAGAGVLDQIGWPILLPMLLAILGSVYAKANVGAELASHLNGLFPLDNPYACALAYGIGMAAFTVLMGNAFAAFPVMSLAIGIPLVVQRHHGDPLAMASIGMLCGYCGTLLTPLAANFNLVPAALLGLEDRFAVIKAQAPTALALLAANLALLCAVVYR
jgi:uncharacterized membrane protein